MHIFRIHANYKHEPNVHKIELHSRLISKSLCQHKIRYIRANIGKENLIDLNDIFPVSRSSLI